MNKMRFVLVLLLVGVAFGFSASSTKAAQQLLSAKLTLSEPRVTTTSNHTFTFTNSAATTTVLGYRFEYCKFPSGTCTEPTASLITTTATKGTFTGFTTGANWTLNAATNGTLIINDSTETGEDLSDTYMSLEAQSITNAAAANCNASDANSSSSTCYVRIFTCSALDTSTCSSSDETNVISKTIVSYTVTTGVQVSARVDPTFTFKVNGVNPSTVNNAITTSVTSTFSTLPFGSLTAGTPKYAAHQLVVSTNTVSGYSITAKMATQMTGTYSANNIDPFAGSGVTWTTPIGWTEPTGTAANTNTGWIGANTTDSDGTLSGYGAQLFGPINNTENIVSYSASSALNDSVYVTYAIEANVYQPADTYTGSLTYNGLPTY